MEQLRTITRKLLDVDACFSNGRLDASMALDEYEQMEIIDETV